MEKQKKMSTTLHLAFWLGALGVHRFYTGYIGWGLIYLLTTGGFGIGVLADLINICRNKYVDKNGNPLIDYNKNLVKIYVSLLIFLIVVVFIGCMISG